MHITKYWKIVRTYLVYVMTFRYIFFADNVEIQDITKKTSLFVLVGPGINQVRNIFFYLYGSWNDLLGIF